MRKWLLAALLCGAVAHGGAWDNAKGKVKGFIKSDFGRNAVIVMRVLSPGSLFLTLTAQEIRKDLRENLRKPFKEKK